MSGLGGWGGIQAETTGPGLRLGQVDLFDNVPQYKVNRVALSRIPSLVNRSPKSISTPSGTDDLSPIARIALVLVWYSQIVTLT